MNAQYLSRRLLATLVVLLTASFLVFAITQLLPGNAAVMMLGEFATPDAVAHLEQQMGLNLPWWTQYWRWLGGILTLDWGVSLRDSVPVFPSVMLAFARSLVLAGLALTIVLATAIPLGTVAALNRGRPADLAVSTLGYLGVSVPEFVVATLLLAALARPSLGWFPAGGYEELRVGFWAWSRHFILPAMSLAVVLVAHISRQIRSELVDVLRADYIRTARLKGISARRVLLRHALPNAMLPTITVVALDIGYLIGGVIVVEEVFAFPGLGRLLIFAVQNRDMPMIQAAALVLAALYTLANLAADLAYALVDRRIVYA